MCSESLDSVPESQDNESEHPIWSLTDPGAVVAATDFQRSHVGDGEGSHVITDGVAYMPRNACDRYKYKLFLRRREG
jgi:hypothetical protein